MEKFPEPHVTAEADRERKSWRHRNMGMIIVVSMAGMLALLLALNA